MGKGKQFGYLCFDKSKFGHLEEEVKKLLERRDSVLYMVDVTRLSGKRLKGVLRLENWLISVDRIIDEAEKIDEEAKKQCFKGLCVNSMKWYRLGKKAARVAKSVVELLEEGKFDRVSNSAISNGDYVSFESGRSALNGVLDALINPDVNMIGVYGMSGIGKTMLVKEAARQVEEDKLFDEVVFAEVSQTPDVKRIRGEIADQLGLSFSEGSPNRIMSNLHRW
ncbi:hypothetical protein AB3S75_023061 [Citrus x aurantiifolia]